MIFELGFELLPFFLIIMGGVFLGLYSGEGALWQVIISALFLAWGCLLIYAIHIVPQGLKLNRVNFRFKTSFKNLAYRIAFFSDLHAGALKGGGWVKRVVETINRENPDLILIGGDFVFRADPQKLKNYLGPLKELKAREGIFAVLGNHDYGVPGEDISSELEIVLDELEISVLHNQSQELQNFTLVGIDEVWAGKANLEKAFLKLKNDKPLISLCHNPDIFLSSSKAKAEDAFHADLWLLGHTHNGQVRLPLLGYVFLPTKTGMEWGFYNTPYGLAFITQGVGESGAKIRFLTSPEVVILELEF